MKIAVRYFARVREALGPGEEVLFPTDAPDASLTVGDLRAHLAARSAAHAQALAPEQALRTACNQVMCGPDQRLGDGAEVAFFPPVTGG